MKESLTIKFKKMRNKEINGTANELRGKLIKKMRLLTDNKLMFEEVKKDEMIGKLQTRLGKTKEEVNKIIAEIQTPYCFLY